ncbi:MAG: hypothetical protein KBD56_05475 [Candidatus Eisenbacteria bacterium]|nr:hypothetical protein [Candidatus Eisenbacteria bacterium]
MRPHFCHCLVAGLFLMLLSLATSQPASATIVFDDHFDGESGGIPEGWSRFPGSGDGAIIESGTTVNMYDDCAMIPDQVVDPSAGVTTLTVEITATNERTEVMFLDSTDIWNHLFVKLWAQDGQEGDPGRIDISACVAGGQEERYLFYAPGYVGGATRLTIVLDEATFSISLSAPPFSTGPLRYDEFFTNFTRTALGSAVWLALGNENHGFSSFSSYDRITMDVASPTPVEATSWTRVKALFHR